MKLNYINIISNNSVGVINRISNLLRKRNYSIEAFSAGFDKDGFGHILVGINLKEGVNIEQVIEQVNKLYDVKEVINLSKVKDSVQIVFNVKCSDEKYIEKVSKKPIKIVKGEEYNSYIFIISEFEKDSFAEELESFNLTYVNSMISMK